MNLKKWLMGTTVALFTMTSLVACSSNSATNQATPAAKVEEDKSPIKIQYWHAHDDDQTKALNDAIQAFNTKYPWITVEPIFQGDYDTLQKKLMAAVAAKEVPAVTNIEVSALPQFADAGVLAELDPYIKRDKVDTKDFSQGMLKAYSFKDKQYALPLIVSTSVFVYNKTMFEKEGVTPPQKWDEIEAFAKKLSKKEGNEVSRYAFSVPGWSTWYYDPWITNAGGSILTEDKKKSAMDQPDSMKFLKNFKEWKDKGYMHIGYGKGASDTMRQMFFDGKIGMVEHTSALIKWYIEKAKFEIGVSFIPGDKKRISHMGGASIAVMEGAQQKQKDAAWKFVEFMTSAERNIKWADGTGYLPTRKSVVTSEEGKAYFTKYPQYKAVIDNFDNVVGGLQHPGYGEFSSAYKDALGKVVLENADPEAELKEAAKKMNDILKDF
ncbi:ABC transporter substrate-binding protein [Paenibacillus sp. KN14-4R]|uniref:ABC transporter substrate-binding protein n=1 Tax=Paenibacillus sp. KN14-4R TaxID=3445773 RepID=UPI003F9FDE4B